MSFTTGARRPSRYQLQHDGGYDLPAPLTGTLQLNKFSGNVQVLDGGGADREVRYPAGLEDVPFKIVNAGATNALLLRDSTGAAIAGVTTQLAVAERATMVNIGGTIRHLGITAITL